MAARSKEKALAGMEVLKQDVIFLELDLGSLESMRAAEANL